VVEQNPAQHREGNDRHCDRLGDDGLPACEASQRSEREDPERERRGRDEQERVDRLAGLNGSDERDTARQQYIKGNDGQRQARPAFIG
jgi:hypothetical protein